ncbi:MAG: Druantia anti-phage system protein DruA [Dehalococcoidia bacterium]|jgi:hypothetical protein
MNKRELRRLVVKSLTQQGFIIKSGHISPPLNLDKNRLRELHATAVSFRREKAKLTLMKMETKLLEHIASGSEVVPNLIVPRLVQVLPNSEEELLFRYASLHWSIPVSSGYGRRLRFLVLDRQNNKLIGIFGLGDPVFSVEGRDEWIGWTQIDKKERLSKVIEAYIMGAVPPYSFLLCGKLIAMLAASNEVREIFQSKYAGQRSMISGHLHSGQLALLVTSSALGRSSIYNRVAYKGRPLYLHAGFTKGSGEFHFSNGIYGSLFNYALANCEPTAKHTLWGRGFRSRRETIKKCLAAIGLSSDWLYHGIQREIFVAPLAQNTQQFLCGKQPELSCFDQSVDDLYIYFQTRWLLPRATRDLRYKQFERSSYRLWANSNIRTPC